jgi:probable HAF family extracellular repeat protein
MNESLKVSVKNWKVARATMLLPTRRLSGIALVVLLCTMYEGAVHAAARYRLTNLGLLNDNHFGAGEDINDSGVAAGSSATYTSNGGWTAVYWTQHAGLKSLGDLPGFDRSAANAINASGQIVGSSWTTIENSGTFGHAFLWSPDNGMTDLGALPGTAWCTALDVNARGQVVGQSQYAQTSDGLAFIWSESEGMRDLGLMPGFGQAAAFAINDSGVVVGYLTAETTNYRHAFRWTSSGGFEDIGQSVRFSTAWDINNHGTIVGRVESYAFLWTRETGIRSLGAPSGYESSDLYAINDAGSAVGYITQGGGMRAAIWTEAQGFQDLNILVDDSAKGWYLNHASGINNHGQIMGTGLYREGQGALFLLTPIPEPHSAWLLTVAIGVVTLATKGQRKW